MEFKSAVRFVLQVEYPPKRLFAIRPFYVVFWNSVHIQME